MAAAGIAKRMVTATPFAIAVGRPRLPTVSSFRYFVTDGGLISYGPDSIDQYRRRHLCRSHPQGREADRPAGAGADHVRTGDHSQNRQGARPHYSSTATHPSD